MSIVNKNIIQDLTKGWKFKEKDSGSWLNASVPSSVHLDLLENRIIPDPFDGVNEKDLQWISEKDWDYMLIFKPNPNLFEGNKIFLNFNGLDTYAEVFLNKESILIANNMFRPWTVDVSSLLKKDNNELFIRFLSPINTALPIMQKNKYVLPADNDKIKMTSPYTRKAPYHYGWDWGPSFATSGIWQPVELFAYDSFRIEDVYFEQIAVDKKNARICVIVSIEVVIPCKVALLITEPNSRINILKSIDLVPGHNEIKKNVEIVDPELWWPVGHGRQEMYNFTVIVKTDSFQDSFKRRVGLRDFKVKQKKDKKGSSFTFVVNGKPIFSKGANWIPADSFTTRLTKENYSDILKSAVEANMNTVRVWGGGIYESDDFYNLCDEMGLIVWQDFMFACTLYPGDDNFLESVREEAEFQVRRLRNHPSIGLWCGNNEVAWAWYNWGWKETFPEELYLKDYKKLFHAVLPAICHQLDPNRLYWPSSPGDNDLLPDVGQQYGSGDNHYWGVWHSGGDFIEFEKNIGRFMSEFGMQSYPDLKTINYFCKVEDQNVNSAVIKQHQKASLGNDNVLKYILMHLKPPKDFASFVMSSQIMAGEAIKIAVESHRRSMPYCMGSLYWQLNDCWPGASWSSLDYFGNWKALHYYAKEFFRPLLISFGSEENYINVYIVNDGDVLKDATMILEVRDFKNLVQYSHNFNLNIQSNISEKVFTVKKKVLFPESKINEVLMRANVVFNGFTVSSNDHVFNSPKNLKIPKQNFSTEIKKAGDIYIIKIHSKSFIYRFYTLCINDTGRFDNNYFNMFPDEEKTIQYFPSRGIKEALGFEPKFEFNSVEDLSN